MYHCLNSAVQGTVPRTAKFKLKMSDGVVFLNTLIVACAVSQWYIAGKLYFKRLVDMKKAIIFITCAASSIMLLDTMRAADSLIMFLLFGMVPGTDIRIAPVDMMAATGTAITVIILRLTVWSSIRTALFTRTTVPSKHSHSPRTVA
jgi:hypothetical protein